MTPSDLDGLDESFWTMMLADFIAERTPRSRTPNMSQCKRLAKLYLETYPEALGTALNATNHVELVVGKLEPDLRRWVRTYIPDLLDGPAGPY